MSKGVGVRIVEGKSRAEALLNPVAKYLCRIGLHFLRICILIKLSTFFRQENLVIVIGSTKICLHVTFSCPLVDEGVDLFATKIDFMTQPVVSSSDV